MVFTVFSISAPFAFAESAALPVMQVPANHNESYYAYKAVITKIEFRDTISVADDNTYQWDLSQNSDGSVKAWLEDVKTTTDENGVETVVEATLCFGGEGGVKLEAYPDALFEGFSSVKTIDFGNLDTSDVVTMERMFDGCSSLEKIDLTGFDTSKTETFCEMFENCISLTEIDLSPVSIKSARTIARMLKGCTALQTVKLNGWYFGEQLIDMSGMFGGCTALKDIYIYDVSYHGNSKPEQYQVYAGVVTTELSFHDNKNIGEDSELWKRFFDDATGAELVFDAPDHYEILLNHDKLELLDGQNVELKVTINPRPNNSKVEFSSADTSVATVNKNGVVTAVGVGTTKVTVTNTTVDGDVTKIDSRGIDVVVTKPSSADCYKIEFVRPDSVEYFHVSKDGGETYIPVYGGTFEYLKETKLIVKAKGNAISYIFSVNGYEIESEYENRLDLVVNTNKTVSVRPIDVPSGEETVSFFDKIIQWFRDLFDKLFGWMN